MGIVKSVFTRTKLLSWLSTKRTFDGVPNYRLGLPIVQAGENAHKIAQNEYIAAIT